MEQFLLGSGDLYVVEFTGTIPENEIVEIEDNRFGYVSGGATLEYKPTNYLVGDDLGYVKKSLITAEEVTFKSGTLIPNLSFIGKAAPTARVTEDADKNLRNVKVGGITNANGKTYLVRFVHKSAVNTRRRVRVTIVGTNQSGFSLAFAKDKESIVDMEFSAEPMDGDGTLIQLEEDMPAPPTPKA